jgi:hypothetical protein
VDEAKDAVLRGTRDVLDRFNGGRGRYQESLDELVEKVRACAAGRSAHRNDREMAARSCPRGLRRQGPRHPQRRSRPTDPDQVFELRLGSFEGTQGYGECVFGLPVAR